MIKTHNFLLGLILLASFLQLSTSEFNSPLNHQLLTSINDIKQHELTTNLRTHERTYSSSSNSIGGALAGFVLGPIIFFMAFICIWFNEKRAVIDYRRLRLAEEICVDVNPLRRDEITAAHMKLTHISGNAVTNEIVRDSLSNLVVNNAIKMQRKVEVMQWRATTTERNGNRETEYILGWQSTNLPTVEGRNNPQTNWFTRSQTIYNQKVFVGQYLISNSQKDKCSKQSTINPDMNHAMTIASNVQRNLRPVIQDGYIYFPSPNSGSISDHGALRIKYTYCPVGPITLMAKTVQNTFEPFPIAEYQGNGVVQKNQLPACCCISNCIADLLKPIQEIELVEEKIINRSQMIENAVLKSKVMTWLIRILAYVMMVAGICLFFSPITTILGFIPLVGGILKGVTGFFIFVAALLICIPLWFIAFSLAWLWYHPKVGAIFLAIGLAILGVILFINFKSTGSVETAAGAGNITKHFLRTWIE